MTLYRDQYEVPDELVIQLRSMFLEDINSDPEAAAKYHPDDVERVTENDWFIARYILHQGLNVDNAFKMLKESLQFRNEMEINTLKLEDFPDAYFDLRPLLIYNHDKRNRPVLIYKSKTHKKNADELRLQKQYLMWWIEKAVRSTEWGPLVFILDCTGSGYKNVDMEFTNFFMDLFKHHYPWSLSIFLMYNMPWYMTAIWKIIQQLIPEKHAKRVVFVDKDSIIEYIDKEQLPACMGGTCTDPYDPKEVEE